MLQIRSEKTTFINKGFFGYPITMFFLSGLFAFLTCGPDGHGSGGFTFFAMLFTPICFGFGIYFSCYRKRVITVVEKTRENESITPNMDPMPGMHMSADYFLNDGTRKYNLPFWYWEFTKVGERLEIRHMVFRNYVFSIRWMDPPKE